MNTESLMNKAFQTIRSLAATVRERGIPSQDSPRASHCRRPAHLLAWLKDLVGRQHRCAMTGSKLYGVFGLELTGLLDAKIAVVSLVILIIGSTCSLLWVLRAKQQKVRFNVEINLVDRVKPEINNIFSENLEDIVNNLNHIIKSKSASLPEEGVNRLKKLLNLVRESFFPEVEYDLLTASKKLYRVSRLTLEFLIQYKDFLVDRHYESLRQIYLISLTAARILEGNHYFNRSIDVDKRGISFLLMSKSLRIFSKAIREYPESVNSKTYENIKFIGEIGLEISKSIKSTVNVLDRKASAKLIKYDEAISKNAVFLAWSVEQFEKKIKPSPQSNNILTSLENLPEDHKKQIDLIDSWINNRLGEEHSTEECYERIDATRERKLFTKPVDNS